MARALLILLFAGAALGGCASAPPPQVVYVERPYPPPPPRVVMAPPWQGQACNPPGYAMRPPPTPPGYAMRPPPTPPGPPRPHYHHYGAKSIPKGNGHRVPQQRRMAHPIDHHRDSAVLAP